MRGSSIDIENELRSVADEVEMLASAVELVRRDSPPAGETAYTWLAVQGLASGVEKIYTGCERVMGMIAQQIDGAKVERDEGWHVALLKRMANPFPEVRGPVISHESYQALDRLRAFRHRERNTYGLSLDRDLVVERSEEAVDAFQRFQSDVLRFLILQRGS
ncbi:hypothetical protein [Methylopila sp. 73B]|uniref:ribonuclease toxin HepT-like protein n=1 Tax=Methylopila sp. 73B TaxID=1120792 RepID=UPI00036D048F|nr:hypothetical protein [Methylopila sp. 73B]